MGRVGAGIKALRTEQLLALEGGGTIEVEGYELGPGDLKVGGVRWFLDS
jgi:hypothetical protein